MDNGTFDHELALPKLPVPALVSTAEQILHSLKPIVSPEEYKLLVAQNSDFINSKTIRAIQARLVRSYEKNDCYLDAEGISTTTPGTYGELRGKTLPRNPFFVLEDDPLSKTVVPPTQASRASALIRSALRFACALRSEVLKPDVSPKSGNPLTMNSYHNLFGTSRIPYEVDARNRQKIGISLKKTESYNDSRHIIVIANSQFYSLEVLTSNKKDIGHKLWFSRHELRQILEDIIADSESTDIIDRTRQSVGSVTTESKATWNYMRLKLAEENKAQLDLIDSALFVVCLDHESPTTDDEKVSCISHGTTRIQKGIQVGSCTSRWYDKLQIIVTKNAVAGVAWESTSLDGTSVLRFISDVYTDSVLRLARQINGSNYTLWPKADTVKIDSEVVKPTFSKLTFNLSNELFKGLHLAETRLADLISQHEYVTTQIPNFGKTFANKMQVSADSLFQVAVQISYYALYGKVPSTAEPISLRRFRKARTEIVSVQRESVLKACQVFISQFSPEEKWEYVALACNEHAKQVSQAMKGKGFERHLSALRSAYIQKDLLAKLYPDMEKINDNEIPPLIFDPAIDFLYQTELLIANCGNPALNLFGVTPSIASGFGIGYIIKDESISVVACSQWRQTKRFLTTLKKVIEEIKNDWAKAHPEIKTKAIGSSRARELEDTVDKFDDVESHVNKFIKSLPQELINSNNSLEYKKKPTSKGDSVAAPSNYILGGYDYFNVGELESRSNQLTRANSTLVSRSGSATNLKALADQNVTTISEKDESNVKVHSPPLSSRSNKNSIGRKLVLHSE
ncbi:hypothetical protein LJB42_002525 [Komagataella kurtzmanii]|nr:hypothetical protein LJB42_002525 [Komagataella kurtzmanii]